MALSRFLAAVALAVSASSLGLAQDAASAAEARKRGEALIAGLNGYDEALSGTTWLGIYLQGRKSIGAMRFDVSKAPDGPATYRTQVNVDLEFGVNSVVRSSSSLLAADVGLIEHDARETSSEEGVSVEEQTRIERSGDSWVCIKRSGEERATYRFPVQGEVHQGVAATILLCRKIDLERPGKIILSDVVWPGVPVPGEPAESPRGGEVTFTVPAPSDFEHRGKTVRAYQIRVERGGDGPGVFVVDEEHRLLAFWPEDSPLRMVVAKSEKQARSDLLPPRKLVPGPSSPEGACALFLQVLGKEQPAKALDRVVDWEAVYDSYEKSNPLRTKGRTPADVRKEYLAEVEATEEPMVDPAVLGDLLQVLEVKIEGDKAKVSFPGLQRPFELRRKGKEWKISALPV